MKVTIQGLDVSVDSMDELEELIQRFGGSATPGDASKKKHVSSPTNGSNGETNSVTHDRVILQHMVDAGDVGVHTNTLGDMLGRKGKAVGAALVQWAIKIRLVADASNNPFEKARPSGGRGWKLKATMMSIAKQLLEDMK
jgi:hypothetical protein